MKIIIPSFDSPSLSLSTDELDNDAFVSLVVTEGDTTIESLVPISELLVAAEAFSELHLRRLEEDKLLS